jgi:hypothetical protein
VTVNAPLGTPDGTVITLALSATSTTSPIISNTAIQNLTAVAGEPAVSVKVAAKGIQAPGVSYADLQFTNVGKGLAHSINVNQIAATSSLGTGMVVYDTALSPPLSYMIGDLAVGASATVRVFFDVPPTVRRFNLVESGTVQDMLGTPFKFSVAQAVIP